MLLGIPLETKDRECRVALTPDICGQLIESGFTIQLEKGAGLKSYYPDDQYIAKGVQLVNDAAAIYSNSDVVLKVNAPTASEIETGQLLIKDKPVAKSSTGDQPPAPTASEIETGQLLIKDKPVSAAATENDLCGVPYTPPCRSDASTAKKAADKVKPGLKGGSVIISLLAASGTIAALVAFSGGNDAPTSP